MTNSGMLFADKLTNCLIYEAGFNQPKCQMYVYYKYAPDGSKLFVLSYVDDCLYWYTYEELGKLLVDTIGKRLYINFLGYAHWFMYIKTSQLKDHYIPMDQDRYSTSVFANIYKLPQ